MPLKVLKNFNLQNLAPATPVEAASIIGQHTKTKTFIYQKVKTMSPLNKIFLLALFSATAGTASFSASAATFSHAEVKAALESTISKVKASISALEKGADQDAVTDLVGDARQTQKDIENNDLEVKRQQASKRLKTAWGAIRDGDRQLAEQSLKDALSRYEEMQKIYASSH